MDENYVISVVVEAFSARGCHLGLLCRTLRDVVKTKRAKESLIRVDFQILKLDIK